MPVAAPALNGKRQTGSLLGNQGAFVFLQAYHSILCGSGTTAPDVLGCLYPDCAARLPRCLNSRQPPEAPWNPRPKGLSCFQVIEGPSRRTSASPVDPATRGRYFLCGSWRYGTRDIAPANFLRSSAIPLHARSQRDRTPSDHFARTIYSAIHRGQVRAVVGESTAPYSSTVVSETF